MFRQQGAILRDLQAEDDTPVPKHVGVVIIVTNFILFNAFVGGSSN